jgi:hypothetical protein
MLLFVEGKKTVPSDPSAPGGSTTAPVLYVHFSAPVLPFTQ